MFATRSILQTLALAAVLAAAAPAQAQHLHSGDIEVEIKSGRIVVEGAAEFRFGSGDPIFEGSLSLPLLPPGSNRWGTDDPGFDSEPGTFLPGEDLRVRGLGALEFWNGTSWQSAVPGNEFVAVVDAIGARTFFRPSGVTAEFPGSTGLIDAAELDGVVHAHVDFYVLNSADQTANAGAPVAAGAYLIQLQLFSTATDAGNPKYLDSTPFLLALNRGLSDEAFESAVHALAVPEPSAALMLLPGLGLLAWRMRNRRPQA